MLLWMAAALANPVEVVEGPRPARDLWVAATAREAALAKCFAGSTAEILLVVTIEADGLVSNAQFRTNDNPDPAVTQCLVSESLRMRVPKRAEDEPKSVFRWSVSPATLAQGVPDDKPQPGQFEVRGALDAKQVQDVISRFENHFLYCYNKEKPRDQDLAGTFDLHVTVDATGSVQDVNVLRLEMPNDRVAECVATKFRSIRFDKPADGKPVLIAKPFSFP
ncbi:MAG: AgmX/PglI C-terminal domain-containing protein [Myxococcota bacterium]